MVNANAAFPVGTYVPVLKAKMGELGAVGLLPVRDRIVPLLEVYEPSRQGVAIVPAWPDDSNVLLVHVLNGEDVDDDDFAALSEDLFVRLRTACVKAVPVITTDDPAVVIGAVARVVGVDGRGVALRIDVESAALASATAFAAEIDALLRAVGTTPLETDLIVDAGAVRDSLTARITTVEAVLRVVPHLRDWRNLVVAYSAFPETLASLARDAVTTLPREDALAFTTLIGRSLIRTPVYGDYAIGNPFYSDNPFTPIPNIRYAEGGSWQVHRAATVSNRSAQYISLATDVVNASYYAGPAASPGDAYLNRVAAGTDGPGTPMTYVRAGTSRHLACVLDRLATLGVP